MKRTKTALISYFLSMSILFLGGFVLYRRSFEKSIPGTTIASTGQQKVTEISVPDAAPDTVYIVRDYGGQIGVFVKENPNTPKMLTGIRTESLRRTDREKLQSGITIIGYENVLILLEDFGS